MLFNTIDFVIFFITVLTVLTTIKKREFQHTFILLASYFFFYYTSNYLITLLIFTTVWDFYFGKAIWKADSPRKKIILILSLAGNLGLLGFFKYADFAITQFNFLGNHFNLGNNIPLLNLALPIGISFYTFHSITYIVEIYRGRLEPAKSFLEYAIFVSFFPQLVAGPILRAKDFLPQLREKLGNSINGKLRQIIVYDSNLKFGITLMAVGFLKKMFFADNIAPFVDEIFAHPVGLDSFQIMFGALAFGIQIYCDFSGYTDIAIGAAKIMGFNLPLNFNKPYFAISPSDFWRRWHVSLSSWLRDYLYVPLGGNRKSKGRTYLNLFIVMFLGGLWHGASWNFVIWGVLHGSFLSIQKVLKDKFPILASTLFFKTAFGKIVSILVTQYFVFFAWIPFRVSNYDQMLYSMQKYIFFDFHVKGIINFIMVHKFPSFLIVTFIGLSLISYKREDLRIKLSNLRFVYWVFFCSSIMAIIFFFYSGEPESFIYFKF